MRPRFFLATVPLVFVLFAADAFGAIVFNSNGFEPPSYSTTLTPTGGYAGQLEGQPALSSPFFEQAGPDTNTATVIANTVVGTGAQVVELKRNGTPDTFWGVQTPATPASVTVSWDMRVEQSMAGNDNGPFFGVQTYAEPGGGFSVLGSLGVDASNGDVLVQDANGFFVDVGDVMRGVWYPYSLQLDFIAKTYSATANNVSVATGLPFVDGMFATYNDFDLVGLQASVAGLLAQGIAYFDNVVVDIQPVPEASAFLMCGVGSLLAFGFYCRPRMVTWLRHAFFRS